MSNIIDKIQISGQSYDVKDSSAATVVELTQQEYDDLPSSAKTGNTLFVITDAQAGDLTQYWTSAQTQSAITEATSGLQQTLTAGTGIDITDNVISVSGVVETSAITTAITSSSTDAQVPSAKAVYDIVGDIETLLSQI